MNSGVLDNNTRKKILLVLKKCGSMSVDDLSRELNITPMGVRQHLLILERNGVVEYITKKHGVGRPGFLYKLTETADGLFPKAYMEFAMDLLTDIEENDGREKMDSIFRRRKDRALDEKIKMLSGKETLPDRLSALAEILQNRGYIAELEEDENHFRLKQFNCPISKLASRFKDICRHDLDLFRELIGGDVERSQCISEGAQSCEYVIPKNTL